MYVASSPGPSGGGLGTRLGVYVAGMTLDVSNEVECLSVFSSSLHVTGDDTWPHRESQVCCLLMCAT